MPTLTEIERRNDTERADELTVRLIDTLDAAIGAAEDARYVGVRHDLDDLIALMERMHERVRDSLRTREDS